MKNIKFLFAIILGGVIFSNTYASNKDGCIGYGGWCICSNTGDTGSCDYVSGVHGDLYCNCNRY